MCSRDLDCANNQVCMTNTSWYTPAMTTTSLGCVCSTYYGFSNFPTCDVVLETTTSHFWLVSGLALILVSIMLIYQSTKQLIRLNYHNMLAIDPATVGVLQAWVGAMCCLIAQAGHIAAALQPERAEHTSGNLPEKDKENDFHLVWMGFQGVSCVTVTCGAITIALMWVNVATRVNNMHMGSSNSGDNETSWANPKLVAAIQFIFLLAVLIPLGINYSFIALVASYFLELGTLGFYLYGSFKITKLIGGVRGNANRVVSVGSSSGDSYTQLLRRMQRSVLVISVCFVAGVVFSTLSLFPTAFGWKEYAWSSDVVSMQIWALQCLYMTVLVAGLEVVRFLRQSIDNRVAKAAVVAAVTISSLQAARPMSFNVTPSVIMAAELTKYKTGV